jgi:Ca2+-binding RTX toxin-like protein
VAERTNATVLKTVGPQGPAGSNPAPSAAAGDGGDDAVFGDNTNFDIDASAGTAGGNDELNAGNGADLLRGGPRNDTLRGGPGNPDDCDGEAGTDTASGCEILAGVP